MTLIDRILGRAPATPTPRYVHKHDILGGWMGDVWTFADPDNISGVTNDHTAKWRCSCGTVWCEQRAFDEYPHITAQRDTAA
jgi:hypothetical protein